MKPSFLKTVLSFAVLALLAAPLAARAGLLSDSWRYKMTVEVETPEGLKTGSAVREVTVHHGLKLTPEMLPQVDLKGEAVVVDLGKRGVLFALLKGGVQGEDYGSDILFYVFPRGSEKKGKKTLTVTQYPMLVTFTDPKDPKTVKEVLERSPNGGNPIQYTIKADHFEEFFGKGVKLKDITIEMTDEPVTRMVSRYLPSYDNQKEYMKWFNSLPYADPRKINIYDFR
jgi:hypothetical protein